MATVFGNDTSSNPWILADEGDVTDKSVKVASFTYCEPDSPAHAVDLFDGHNRPILQLNETQRNIRFDGWVHGLRVERLDSGYVIVALRDA